MRFGEYLRQLREEQNLLLREVSAQLKMDMAYISKIERGTRKARKEQVTAFAKAYNVKSTELQKRWLVDQIKELLKNEKDPIAILKATESTIDNDTI